MSQSIANCTAETYIFLLRARQAVSDSSPRTAHLNIAVFIAGDRGQINNVTNN